MEIATVPQPEVARELRRRKEFVDAARRELDRAHTLYPGTGRHRELVQMLRDRLAYADEFTGLYR